MKSHPLLPSLVLLLSAASVYAGGVDTATMDRYRQLKDDIEKLAGSKVAKYAPETVEAAGKSISAAQEGIKAGDQDAVKRAVDIASAQKTLALALSDERESAEKTASAKAALEAQEKRLADILAGKGESR